MSGEGFCRPKSSFQTEEQERKEACLYVVARRQIEAFAAGAGERFFGARVVAVAGSVVVGGWEEKETGATCGVTGGRAD